ncbi:MAG TPA: hypothetical protein VEY88_13015 [Archangium sp.]|nr:hypothetical protein [Archangium sp.]
MRPPVVGILRTLLIALLGVLLVRSFSCFTPGSVNMKVFDADMAIPVLMANGSSGLWLFDVYFYGQDRLGAWPFLLQRLAGWIAGFDWTMSRMFQVQATAMLLAGVPLALLVPRAGLVAATACVLVSVTNPGVFSSFFFLGQPYPWQVLTLGCAWGLVHSLLLTPQRPGWRLGGLAAVAFLSVWTSPTSGPLLLLLLGVEFLGRRGAGSWRERLWHAVPVGLMVAVGMAGERILRGRYHHAARDAFGSPHRTGVRLDEGYLLDNAQALADVWRQSGWTLTLVLAVAAVGAFCVLRVRAWRGARAAEVPAGWEALTLAVGAACVAAANFVICVAVEHVRLNAYDGRYLALTHLFLAAAAALAVLAGAEALLARTRAFQWVAPVLALGMLGVAHLGMPPAGLKPEQLALEATARALQPEQGRRVLLGSYWESYPYAALARPGTVVAVPVEWDYQRTPFDHEWLRAADEVVVNHTKLDAFGPAAAPHRFILQHGLLFRLVRTASPLEGFSVYARADRDALQTRPEPPLDRWNLCDPTVPARLRFTSERPVTVLVRSSDVREGDPVPAGATLAGRALPVVLLPGFYRVEVDRPVTREMALEFSALAGVPENFPGCRVHHVSVLPSLLPDAAPR